MDNNTVNSDSVDTLSIAITYKLAITTATNTNTRRLYEN